ncbi:MLO-like protein 4, partial [Linum perenne]
MDEVLIRQGRSLAETPTYYVATVVTVLVFVCFVGERAIYRFGKWLKQTRRKALYASLEKIKEELMLLGIISLSLAQW